MPEILHRCVNEVMGKGHDEQSAYAICRTSLGLKADGSQDRTDIQMSDEQIRQAVAQSMTPAMDEPVLRKWMTVAHPLGEFKNGNETGILDRKVLSQLVGNYKTHAKQVPIYLWDHVTDLDSTLPDGWVEDARMKSDGQLEVYVKLHGEAAALVKADRIRGASIGWQPKGKGFSGESIGAVLKHITLTNQPFITDLPNIAAARSQGGEPLLQFFTALSETEATMADKEKNDVKPDAPADDAAVATLKVKEEEVIALKAETLRLKEQIETLETRLANSSVDKDKEQALIENHNLKRDLFAMKVRAVVDAGLKGGTLKASWCDGYAGKGVVDYDGTLRWLKASRFYDPTISEPETQAFRILKFTAENNPPMYKVGQTFKSGSPATAGETQLSNEDRAEIRKLGLTPDAVVVGMKSTDYSSFKELSDSKES